MKSKSKLKGSFSRKKYCSITRWPFFFLPKHSLIEKNSLLCAYLRACDIHLNCRWAHRGLQIFCYQQKTAFELALHWNSWNPLQLKAVAAQPFMRKTNKLKPVCGAFTKSHSQNLCIEYFKPVKSACGKYIWEQNYLGFLCVISLCFNFWVKFGRA